MKALLAACLLFIGSAQSGEAAAQQDAVPPNAKAAISAATSFSIGYGVWLWEKKCRTLSAEDFAAFDTAVTGQLQRLSGMLDLRMLTATLGAGRDMANDTTTTPHCDATDALDFAKFGVDMVKDSGEQLATIPLDYHLAIAN